MLENVCRLQTGSLLGWLEERERYIQWLESSRYWPDAPIELKVNRELVAMIKAELFIRRGSQ
jgi:hypothetical protein